MPICALSSESEQNTSPILINIIGGLIMTAGGFVFTWTRKRRRHVKKLHVINKGHYGQSHRNIKIDNEDKISQ